MRTPHTALAAGELVTLKGEPQRVDQEQEERKWCQLFPLVGKRYRSDFGPDGFIDFNREWCERMLANWVREGRPHLHVNYDHSFGGVAAGWIEDIEVRGTGLYALIRWTQKARTHIRADEYRYLSPEFEINGTDRATGNKQGPTLRGCALLNDPYLIEMPRVAASHTPHAAHAAGEKTMDLAKLAALLGLAVATATEEEITKSIEQIRAKAGGADELAKKLAEKETELSAAKQAAETLKLGATETQKLITDLRDQCTKLAGQLQALESDRKQEKAKALADELLKDGCIYPAQVPAVMQMALAQGIDKTRSLFAAGPRVALGERGVRGADGDETPEEANQKLQAIAADLVKQGTPKADALLRAIELNPKLAERAQRASVQ